MLIQNEQKPILLMCFILIIASIILLSFIEDEPDPTIMYCKMVETFKETNGQYGWPDYNDNYEVVCDE